MARETREISSSSETPPPSSIESNATLLRKTSNLSLETRKKKPEVVDLTGEDNRPCTPPEQTPQVFPARDFLMITQTPQKQSTVLSATPGSSTNKRKFDQAIQPPSGVFEKSATPLDPEPQTPSTKRSKKPSTRMGKAIDIETGKISSFKDRLDEEMRGACDAVPRSPEESDDEYFAKVWEEISMQRVNNPLCLNCGRLTKKWIVKADNPIGNAGRTSYRCDRCGKWHGWGDLRGIVEGGQTCYCKGDGRDGRKLARLAVASGRGQREKGTLYWTCARIGGECEGYYEDYTDLEGNLRVLSDEERKKWMDRKLI